MLLEARQAMAERTPASLATAVSGCQAVILKFPDLPGGFTGPAETYLLSCEYATMPRARAFASAQAAVRTALALAPADADGHRIKGFLHYWTTRDIEGAIPDFEIAVTAEHPNYLAHLWYGNALIDAGGIKAGGDGAALRTLAAAEPIMSPFWHGGELTSAIAASLLGDRNRLIEILRNPKIREKNWRPLHFPAQAFRRRRSDPVAGPLLLHAFGVSAERLWLAEAAKR